MTRGYPRKLTLLQIGDVHLPEKKNVQAIDLQDGGFPRRLLNRVACNPLSEVLMELCRILQSSTQVFDGALICGDLTSKGGLTGYQECVRLLHNCLGMGDPGKWTTDRIHVVPGNHDIERGPLFAGTREQKDKFLPLNQVWSELGMPVLSAATPRITAMAVDNMKFSAISLNSCVGCGDMAYIPEMVRKSIEHSFRIGPDDFEIYGYQLDTPAFDNRDIGTVCGAIANSDSMQIPVILTHHNLLPQRVPRIQVYTEIVNGGSLRDRLCSLNRPILYCHGHTHDDLVEIVNSVKHPDGCIICIGAPELSSGFNIIEIQYSRNGQPLGCVIRPFRVSPSGTVDEKNPIRVPIYGGISRVRLRDSLAQALHETLGTKIMRFPEIVSSLRSKDTEITFEQVASAACDLEWLGLARVGNRNEDVMYWHLEGITP